MLDHDQKLSRRPETKCMNEIDADCGDNPQSPFHSTSEAYIQKYQPATPKYPLYLRRTARAYQFGSPALFSSR